MRSHDNMDDKGEIIKFSSKQDEVHCPVNEIMDLVQLLLLGLYGQWGPRKYEKYKMSRLIHIIMMSLNIILFRFVAQVATLGNFFY